MSVFKIIAISIATYGLLGPLRAAHAQDDDMAPVPYSSGPTSKPTSPSAQRQSNTSQGKRPQAPAIVAVPMSWLPEAVHNWLDVQYQLAVRDIGFWLATGKSYESATEDERATYDAGRLITLDRKAAVDYYDQHVAPGMARIADPNDTTDPTQTNYDDNPTGDTDAAQPNSQPSAQPTGGADADDDDGS